MMPNNKIKEMISNNGPVTNETGLAGQRSSFGGLTDSLKTVDWSPLRVHGGRSRVELVSRGPCRYSLVYSPHTISGTPHLLYYNVEKVLVLCFPKRSS